MTKRRKWYIAVGIIAGVVGVVVTYITRFAPNMETVPWWGYLVAFVGTSLYGLFILVLCDGSCYWHGFYGESWLDEPLKRKKDDN